MGQASESGGDYMGNSTCKSCARLIVQSSAYSAIDVRPEGENTLLANGFSKPVDFYRDLSSFYGDCWSLQIGSVERFLDKRLRTYFLVIEKTEKAEYEF